MNDIKILSDGQDAPECRFSVNTKKIKEISGDERVNKIEFEDGSQIDIDGIFVAMGTAGASDFAKKLGIMQDGESIIVDDKMKTNIDGIYACGDATGGLYQVSKAVYEGSVARTFSCKLCKKFKGGIKMVNQFNEENFEEEVLKSEGTVLVDFYADWCMPCKMMAPAIEQMSEENGNVKFGKINVDDNQGLSEKYNIMSIPTIMIFKAGIPVKTFVGVTPKDQILAAIK